MCLPPNSNRYLRRIDCDGTETVLDECEHRDYSTCRYDCGIMDSYRELSTVRCQPGDALL